MSQGNLLEFDFDVSKNVEGVMAEEQELTPEQLQHIADRVEAYLKEHGHIRDRPEPPRDILEPLRRQMIYKHAIRAEWGGPVTTAATLISINNYLRRYIAAYNTPPGGGRLEHEK